MTGFEERCLRCFRCSRSGSFSLLSFLTLRFSLAGDASARSTSGSLSLVGMVLCGVAHLGRCVMGSSCARKERSRPQLLQGEFSRLMVVVCPMSGKM